MGVDGEHLGWVPADSQPAGLKASEQICNLQVTIEFESEELEKTIVVALAADPKESCWNWVAAAPP